MGMIQQITYSAANVPPGNTLSSEQLEACRDYDSQLFQRPTRSIIFLMSITTTVVGSDEKLCFDNDGHLEFGPDDPENPKNFLWTQVLHHRHRHFPRHECHLLLFCTNRLFPGRQRRPPRLCRSRWPRHHPLPPRLLRRSAILGALVRVLWPSLDLLYLFHPLSRLWLPLRLYA